MGCVSSKADLRPNIFQVWNVDERGNLLTQGQLEVTETELVLHQKGKEAIRWPMRCLRRYGFDAQVFSFESGRRCATGSGIYAFRSRRAEALFNLLQEHIQNSGQESDAGSQHMGSGHVLSSTATGMNVVHRSGSVSTTDAGAYLEPIRSHRPRSFSRDSFPPRSTCTPASVPIPNSISCPSGGLIVSPTATSSVPRHNGDVASYMNEDLSQVALQTTNPEGSLEASPRSLAIPPCPVAAHEYVNTAVVAVGGEVTERRSSGCAGGSGGGVVDVVAAEQKVSFSVLDLRQQSGGGVVANGPSVGDNTNYARLDDLMKQEQEAKHHLYMNVLPDIDSSKVKTAKNGTVTGSGSFSSTSSTCSSGSSTTSQGRLSLPPFAISHLHCYANVAPSARPKVTSEPQGQPQANNNNNVNNNNNNMNKSNIQHHHHHARHHSHNHGHHHHHSLSYPQAAGSTAVTRQVNYVILDLDRGAHGGVGAGAEAQCSSSSSLPVSPTSPTSVTGPPVSVSCSQASQPPDSPTRGAAEGYATIDFDKTAALSNTVNPCLDDESIRKTRHNSTIADLPILRHNSTVGELN